MANKGRNT